MLFFHIFSNVTVYNAGHARLTMNTQDSAIGKLGARMLSGWALLADECPDCANKHGSGTPLVRRASDGAVECVVCETSFVEDRENGGFARKEQNGAAPAHGTGSDEGKEGEDSDDELDRQLREVEARVEQKRAGGHDSVQPRSEVASSSNTSKSMGDYLLRGWTMLADNCPRCKIPLMRKPEAGTMHCVSCGAQVIRPEEFDPAKHAVSQEGASSGPSSAARQARTTGEDNTSGVSDLASSRSPQQPRYTGKTPAETSAAAKPPLVSRRDSGQPQREPPSYDRDNSAEVVPSSSSTGLVTILERKLAALGQLLDAADADDLDRIQRLCETISSASKALEATRNVHV